MQKASIFLACAMANLVAVTGHAQTSSSQALSTPVSGQPLADALELWAEQTGWQLMYDSSLVVGRKSAGSPSGLRPIDALMRILDGTGLECQFLNERTISILPVNGTGSASCIYPQYRPTAAHDEHNGSEVARLAVDTQVRTLVAAQDQASGRGGQHSRSEKTDDVAAEVIVSAQKRLERLEDVPVPVTAITAESLVKSNQLRFQDYFARVPGLNFTVGLGGFPNIAIRGLTTGGFSNPTVGIVIDDIPYGSSTANGGGWAAADIDPNDLARIEVLRGPQGTLYGASSMGGLVKFVTVDPSTDEMSGSLQVGGSSVRNGDNLGYSVRGSVNVPLGDTVALRASGFTRHDPGYIDVPGFSFDPTHFKDGINAGRAYGGRLSALWQASDDVTLKLTAMQQEKNVDGQSFANTLPGFGDLQQQALRGTGEYDNKSEVYSASLIAKLGISELTAISAYSVNTLTNVYDFTEFYAPLSEGEFGVPGTAQPEYRETKKFSQEVRLVTPIGSRLEWLLGAFYTHEDTFYETDFLAVDPVTLDTAGSWFHGTIPSTFSERALFTNLAIQITERFDVQIGGRQSQDRQATEQNYIGPYFAGGSNIIPKRHSKENFFTYLLAPRFKVTPDLMMYARFASGYRAGGPNYQQAPYIPSSFKPDTTRNYEVGVKGSALDDRLTFDASVYYIDWKDIQTQIFDVSIGGTFYLNAGGGRSQGAELSLEARPLAGLTVAGWVAWCDAELTKGYPSDTGLLGLTGTPGEKLPFSSPVSGSISMDQEFPLMGALSGFAGGSLTYVGSRAGGFKGNAQSPQPNFPSYFQLDLRAGIRRESWEINAFATNVADRRALLSGDPEISTAVTYIQPRTIGVAVSKSF